MKILFSHFGINSGEGGFARSFMLAKGLASLGHNITFIATQPKGFIFPYKKEIKDGITILSFPDIIPVKLRCMGLGFLSLLLKLIYVSFNKFDIVQSDTGHRPSSGFPCLLHRFLKKSKYFSEWRDFYGKGGQYEHKNKFFRAFYGKFEILSEINDKKRADGIIVLSEFMKNRALKYSIPENKITIIHGGANIDCIKYVPDCKFRSKFNLPQDYLIFGYICTTEEDIEDLSPFISALKKFNDDVKIKWFTVGFILQKGTKEKLKITNRLVEIGWVDFFQNSDVLSCADVYILLKEPNQINISGWPNKLGDYMACGRLIMLNPYGDVKQFVDKYPEGFVQVKRDIKDIENKIQILYSKKKKTIYQMGKKNREIAEKIISWDKQSEKLLSFYNKII